MIAEQQERKLKAEEKKAEEKKKDKELMKKLEQEAYEQLGQKDEAKAAKRAAKAQAEAGAGALGHGCPPRTPCDARRCHSRRRDERLGASIRSKGCTLNISSR